MDDQAVQQDEDGEEEEQDDEGDDDEGEDDVEDDVRLLIQLLLLLLQSQKFRVNPADLWLISIRHVFSFKEFSACKQVIWYDNNGSTAEVQFVTASENR